MPRTKIDEGQVANLMRVCGVSREEALNIIAEDQNINRMKMSEVDNDLTEQQKAVVKKMRDVGSRKVAVKKPMILKLDTDKRPKKKDVTKEKMIAALAEFITNSTEIAANSVEVTNPSKEIAYMVNGERYVLSIVRNRTKKT